jgi:Domain of unknown function (DUF4296)
MRLKRIALIGIVFLFSCGDKSGVSSGIIKPAKMQKVLFDVLRAEAFVFDFVKKDSVKNLEAESVKLQQQIFAVHKVTKEEFYKSYDFYKTHPDLMQPLLDSMISKATKDKYMNTKSGNASSTPVVPVVADTSIGKAMREKYGRPQLGNIADTLIKNKILKKKKKRLKRSFNAK